MNESMRLESQSAMRLLNEICEVNKVLLAMAQRLRAQPEISSVERGIDFRVYQGLPVMEVFVEAELRNNTNVGWWLELRWTEREWRIRYSVRAAHEQGEDAIQEFPDLVTNNLDGLIQKLNLALSNLIGSSEALPWRDKFPR